MPLQLASMSKTWAADQLARLARRQPDLVNPAIQELLTRNHDLRWALVVGAYLEKEINLGKAAEMLAIHELELRERFIQLGIPLRIGPADLDAAQAEVDSLEKWPLTSDESAELQT